MRKFKKLYLHVGLEKTGTTSIQKSMHKHREELEALGYYYPREFAVGKNSVLAAMFLKNPFERENFRHVINKRGGTQEKLFAIAEKAFAAEIENASANNLVLSSEFLGAQSDLIKVKAFCDKISEQTEIIVYLREQCSFMLSVISTHLKGGGQYSFEHESLAKNSFPFSLNFESVVAQLEKVFPGQLSVRLFDKSYLFSGDVVQDFYVAIGLKEHAAKFVMPRANESLSQVGVTFLQRFNPSIPVTREGVKNAARDRLIQDIGNLDATGIFGKASLTPEYADQVGKVFAEGNEAVRKRYFPKRDELFPAYQPAPMVKIDEDDITSYAAHLLEKAHLDLHAKQELLNEIAPVLNALSKNKDLKDHAKLLKDLNKKILQNRKL